VARRKGVTEVEHDGERSLSRRRVLAWLACCAFCSWRPLGPQRPDQAGRNALGAVRHARAHLARSSEIGVSTLLGGYALHDALVKPMPGNLRTPSLAESWTVSHRSAVYEFKLREGLRFTTAIPSRRGREVQLQSCQGSADSPRQSRGGEGRRFLPGALHLHQPWPDFMTFYGTLVNGQLDRAKKYLEKSAMTASRSNRWPRAYKFVSHQPASSWCWRRTKATGVRCVGEAARVQERSGATRGSPC